MTSDLACSAGWIDHDLTHLRSSKADANVGVEIRDQHLDPPGAQRLREPTARTDTRRGVGITEGEDEAALGSAAGERDELQRIPRDLVKLRSLQSSLVGEYLHQDRLVRCGAIHIDARPAIQSKRPWRQLDTDDSRYGVADQWLGA